MHRRFKCSTKARLSFSGRSHAPVNRADSMDNASSWTVSGSKEAMEVLKNFKQFAKMWRMKYSAVQRSKRFYDAIYCVFLHLKKRFFWGGRGFNPPPPPPSVDRTLITHYLWQWGSCSSPFRPCFVWESWWSSEVMALLITGDVGSWRSWLNEAE